MVRLDFEVYSEAGYIFDPASITWSKLPGAVKQKKGIEIVGAAVYAEHPSTEVLILCYQLADHLPIKKWVKGDPPPYDLFEAIERGELFGASNSLFEYYIWHFVCHLKMGWRALPLHLMRDSQAKARAFNIPGALAKSAKVLRLTQLKLESGKDWIRKYCIPKQPTKKDSRLRREITDDPVDYQTGIDYCAQDVVTEREVDIHLPELTPYELEVWLLDQRINVTGVHIDALALDKCIEAIEVHSARLNGELFQITAGIVGSGSELDKMLFWLENRGHKMLKLDKGSVSAALKNPLLPPDVRRVLEIRQKLSMSSTAKVYAMKHKMNSDHRVRDLFAYCGASQTGRFAGRGIQVQNLPSQGPEITKCKNCGTYYKTSYIDCPRCGLCTENNEPWSPEAANWILDQLGTNPDFDIYTTGDPFQVVSGCLRGLITPTPGYEFISSDYSAIEAVVIAGYAEEDWRLEVFRTHGKIYEMSASKITGIPFEDMLAYKKEHGEHHPMRKKVGKVAELASGFGGGEMAWRNFGAHVHLGDEIPEDSYYLRRKVLDALPKDKVAIFKDQYPLFDQILHGALGCRDEIIRQMTSYFSFSDEKAHDVLVSAVIGEKIALWRRESPQIVNFWRAVEDCAKSAILNPNMEFSYKGITYFVQNNILHCRLLSGRLLRYHEPQLVEVEKWGRMQKQIVFKGIDSITGAWVELTTYGGKLTENIVQATARDILAHALLNVDRHGGYRIVMHIHDEIVCEVPEGHGSVEELEALMSDLPEWCKHWPVKAQGGWRGKRFKKD